jgi:hypothetical protein
LILYLVFRAHLRELRVFRRYRALVTSEAALEDRLGEAGLTSR